MLAARSISLLPADVAEKVAAGEVIQRPADAVKELVENAIDAVLDRRARSPGTAARIGSIQVELKGGGLELIRVADDGCGIASDELDLALARHGTSKLRDLDGLSRVQTLGFRGEALPSIGAVADVTVVSRADGAPAGAFAIVEGGRAGERGARGCPVGTQVYVKRLFYNLPARLAFQRSAAAEAAQVAHLLGVYALAYPELRFSLVVDGRRVLEAGGGERRDGLAAVYGQEVAAGAVAVEYEDPAGVSVSGLISPPDLTRGSRGDVLLFVNRRPVQNRSLTHAVVEAYRGFLPDARYPLVAIDVRTAPDEVDVNVHPSKTEVRFRRDRLVYATVQRGIRQALLATAPPPSVSAPLRTAESWAPIPPPAEPAEPSAWPTVPPPRPAPAPAASAQPTEDTAGGVRLPILRIVGQVQGTYVVCEGPDGVYFVDQHAAHERVLYEQVLAERARGGISRQNMLQPLVVELTGRQCAQLAEHADALRELGFEAEPFGPSSALVRAVPAGLTRANHARALVELLEALSNPTPTVDGLDRAAATVACHAAVRAGDALSPELMRELIQQLENTDIGRFCPHGRPTVVRLPAAQLERDFGRR